VDEVYVDFGKLSQRPLREVTADEMRAYHAAGQFPAGSMGPKVESALRFVEAGGRRSIITSLERLPDALADKAGTHINGRPDQERAQ
jgi:carbamate kinase